MSVIYDVQDFSIRMHQVGSWRKQGISDVERGGHG